MVRVHCTVPEVEAREGLRLVADYRNWPEASESVRSVVVEPGENGASTSFWEVAFRGGLMKWSEADNTDLDGLVHTFDLIEGDPHGFSGTWTAEQVDGGCELRMDADFDLGMPSLGHVLDPVAIEALEDAVVDVVRNLFGENVRLAFGERVSTNGSI
jgi:hypothetical protein